MIIMAAERSLEFALVAISECYLNFPLPPPTELTRVILSKIKLRDNAAF